MSPHLSTALGFGIRELAQAAVLVMSAAGALVLAAVAAQARPLAPVTPAPRHRLGGAVVTGRGGRTGAPRRGPGTVQGRVPDHRRGERGSLVIGAAGAADRTAAGQVVVRRGESLRVAAAEIDEPEEFLASGRAVWLCAEGGQESGPGSAAAARARRGDRRPADGQDGVFGEPGGAR